MEGRVFENFQNFFFSKFQKCPKSFPKVSKCVLNLFWVKFSEKFFCPVFCGGSSFRKFSKKIFSKFQKCPKVFPKVSKRVLNMFWGKFLEKFLPSFPWNVESSKNFKKKNQKICKIPEMPKIVPKSIQTCFELVLGQIFRKNFSPTVAWRVEFSKFFLKIKKFSKFKNAQNRSQKFPNMF